jgi:hypothetical protein
MVLVAEQVRYARYVELTRSFTAYGADKDGYYMYSYARTNPTSLITHKPPQVESPTCLLFRRVTHGSLEVDSSASRHQAALGQVYRCKSAWAFVSLVCVLPNQRGVL